MGYFDASKHRIPGRIVVDGLTVDLIAKNTQKGMRLGPIKRATIHWTADRYTYAYDDYHYCFVWDKANRKMHVVKMLRLSQMGQHAKLANTGNVGMSFCAMRGATSLSNLGPEPIEPEMLKGGAIFAAEFCAWHKLDPRKQLVDHRIVDKEIGRNAKWDIEPYWDEFLKLAIEHYDKLKTGKAQFQYKNILKD